MAATKRVPDCANKEQSGITTNICTLAEACTMLKFDAATDTDIAMHITGNYIA